MIEEAKKTSIVRPPTSNTVNEANKVALEQTRKAAADKVNAMINRAEAVYYGEENSIATIEDRVELMSSSKYSKVVSQYKSIRKHNSMSSVITNSLPLDNKSITSSVIWETMLSKQSQIGTRLDKIDSTLEKIL